MDQRQGDLDSRWRREYADNDAMATDLDTIMKLKVPLIVTVGSQRLPLDSVLAFAPGSIIELNKSSDEPLEILINNKNVGTGEAIKVGENFGVRISKMRPPDQRVHALGT